MPNSKQQTNSGAGANLQLKFTPPVLTKQQILERGEQAAKQLQSPVFQLAYQSVVQSLQDQITNTEPHESQKREWLNLKVKALGDVSRELGLYVALAVQISDTSLAEESRNQNDQSNVRRGGPPGDANFGYDSAPIT